jgi:hypothetical protein
MLDAIQSKAGLVGYYEGSIKYTLSYLRAMPEKDKTWEVKCVIEALERSLANGGEIWERVKGGE